jgi:hypothetical protein
MNIVRDSLTRFSLSIGTLAGFLLRTRHHRVADREDGVQALYLDLGLTSTELLVGCGDTTIRYPVAELAARINDAADGKSGDLLIDGPGVSVQRPLQYGPDGPVGDPAWKFAQTVNYVASDHGSVRAACAWVDANGIRWSEPRLTPRPPRREPRTRRGRPRD